MIRGRDIIPYGYSDYEYLIGTYPSLKLNIEDYPAIKNHLLSFGYDRLKQTGESGARKKTSGKWFETQDSISYYREFSKPKIVYPNMTSVFPFMYDESGIYTNQKCFILTANDPAYSLISLSAILNSSLTKLWIWYNCPELLGGTREISKVYFENFPVPNVPIEKADVLEELAKMRINLTGEFQTIINKFRRSIERRFEITEMTTKLYEWWKLSFKEYVKELKKNKIQLTIAQESEWEEYFSLEVNKVKDLQAQIDQTDKEIDRIVYEFYGLSEEEIRINNNHFCE
jgi:hypothetical protein